MLSTRLADLQAAETAGAISLTLEDGQKLAALTFDDGPDPRTTPLLLDGLAERGVHATFFVIGRQLEGNEELIRRMEAEGHQVGNHTWDHKDLTGLSRDEFNSQLGRTEEALRQLLGHGGFYIRPPWGFQNGQVRAGADAPLILWSVDTLDWRDRDSALVRQRILNDVQDGSIILLHDLYPSSVEGALAAADVLLEEGYQLVTVEELLRAKGIDPQPGELYFSADPEM